MYLVGYGVGARCGAGDVVETVGHGSILHDITGVNDVWASRWDLNFNLITNTSRLRTQAHPGEQLGEFLGRLTVNRKKNKFSMILMKTTVLTITFIR